jgi:hydrogenase small subunit
MPGFPDKFSPFYKTPPGSAASSAGSTAYGKLTTFLRGFTRRYRNREKRWDKTGDVPSGWALQKETLPALDRMIDFFYSKLQYANAVKPGRQIPETRYRDGWEVASKKRGADQEQGEMKWGYARRRAKLEREAALKKAAS